MVIIRRKGGGEKMYMADASINFHIDFRHSF